MRQQLPEFRRFTLAAEAVELVLLEQLELVEQVAVVMGRLLLALMLSRVLAPQQTPVVAEVEVLVLAVMAVPAALV